MTESKESSTQKGEAASTEEGQGVAAVPPPAANEAGDMIQIGPTDV